MVYNMRLNRLMENLNSVAMKGRHLGILKNGSYTGYEINDILQTRFGIHFWCNVWRPPDT